MTERTAPPAKLDEPKVAAARLFAASRYPYLASALFALSFYRAPGSGTIAVERRWRCAVDPEVMVPVSPQDLGRLLVHLVSHLLRDHAGRAGLAGVAQPGGDPGAWRGAADAEVNDDLVPQAMVPPMAPGQPADLGDEDGRLAEHYYHLRFVPRYRWDCGEGCDGARRPWQVDDGDGLDGRQAEWLRLGVAHEMKKCEGAEPGTVSAGWLRWAEEVMPSKVDWRRVLAAELRLSMARAAGMVDYSYRRPSRRAASSPGVVLASLERPVPDVAIVCDTSGSMSEAQLGAALVEVEAVLRGVGSADRRVRALACDAEVHAVRRVSRAREVLLLGGGGTDMGEGIAQAAQLKPRPSVIVVLTDGMTPWPDRAPPGIKVVVGLLSSGRGRNAAFFRAPAPEWAKVVPIEVAG